MGKIKFHTSVFWGVTSGIITPIQNRKIFLWDHLVRRCHFILEKTTTPSICRLVSCPDSLQNGMKNPTSSKITRWRRWLLSVPYLYPWKIFHAAITFLFSWNHVRPISECIISADAAYTGIHMLGSLRTAFSSLLFFGQRMVSDVATCVSWTAIASIPRTFLWKDIKIGAQLHMKWMVGHECTPRQTHDRLTLCLDNCFIQSRTIKLSWSRTVKILWTKYFYGPVYHKVLLILIQTQTVCTTVVKIWIWTTTF